jgi:hypothetical protein
MLINGSSKIQFPDGSGQQILAISATGAVGAVQYSVTQIPASVVSVRKTATSAALTVGAPLTPAEAAALIVTRTAGTGLGPVITAAATVGVRSRTYVTGAVASAFTVGTQANIDAVKNGNFWEPNFPTAGTGTRTVDILIDVGTPIKLANIPDIFFSLGYSNPPTNGWAGVTAKAIISTDGVAVTVLGSLLITANGVDGNKQKNISGNVTTTVSARWVGIRLELVPVTYPLIMKNASFRAATSSGFTTLPTPVFFSVRGTDSGGLGSVIPASSAVGVRSRTYNSNTASPAFTVGSQANIDAVKVGNFWEPNFPGSGTGTKTVEILVDVGSAISLGNIPDIQFNLGYGPYTSDPWVGVIAKAIVSTDGVAVTSLNTLTIAPNQTDPNKIKNLSGAVTGAPSARWVGVRLENVPAFYPLILQNISFREVGAAASIADFTVPIGDSTTNFGTTPPASNIVIYGDLGTRFPLGIAVQPPATSYTLTIMSGLSLVEQIGTPGAATVGTNYTPTNAAGPFAPSQLGAGVSNAGLAIFGTDFNYDGTTLNLSKNAYLATAALGIGLATSSDPAKTMTPSAMTVSFVGVIPLKVSVIAGVHNYADGGITIYGGSSAGTVKVLLERGSMAEWFDSIAGLSNTNVEDIAVRYVDNINGAGGTITFLRNGVAFGPSQTTTLKPRISPLVYVESNASAGNPAAAVDQGQYLKVKRICVTIDLPVINYSYVAVSNGAISAARLQNLFVDATAISAAQPLKRVTYQAAGGPVQAVDVAIGPVTLPAGTAHRAVLEDWSTGVAVSHPNTLVMTKFVRQNCKFEDGWLFDAQPGWAECLPQGSVPIINGIAYYCEATRIGIYAQFQFGYDWHTSVMPNNPFGDPTGKESYMVPHKWRIEDSGGVVLGVVQRPDGGPLNGTDIPRIFAGSYDGRNVAITNATNKWYPHGTVRSAIIWRSSAPVPYSQSVINAQLPRYDVTVPFAMHTDYSCNGFDYRIYVGGAGGDGQSNGFGNTRVMPYDPTNYATLVLQAGVSQDPYKASLYSANSLAAVSSTWLKYTPFNQCGRTPTTGPGGIRDERVAIPEPVLQYMYNINANRPHDGRPYSQIALDYLTSYASDPFHCFEKGRCVPLFKGVNATRVITLRNHYYGGGEASTPPERAYYIQSGRLSDVQAGLNPFRSNVPSNGFAADKPYFGTNAIDSSHAHQFPYWGSMLWQSPEFAFLGHKLWDQDRLYGNFIIGEPYAVRWAERDGAWQFLHAVLAWKTASANSDRLYNRSEVMAFVVKDFESFNDTHKVTTPGFDNPPTNIFVNGSLDTRLGIYALAARFGPGYYDNGYQAFIQHDFFIGYWVSALGIAEKLGFNAALRAQSAKAGQVLDWLIAQHRKRIVGRINQAPRANLGDNAYTFLLWRSAAITSAAGAVAPLAQNYAAIATQNGNAATWDVSTDVNGVTSRRDGQGNDQLMAGPSILKNQLKLTGTDIDSAVATVSSWRTQKINEQLALGVNAGESWFISLNGANNPALS